MAAEAATAPPLPGRDPSRHAMLYAMADDGINHWPRGFERVDCVRVDRCQRGAAWRAVRWRLLCCGSVAVVAVAHAHATPMLALRAAALQLSVLVCAPSGQ